MIIYLAGPIDQAHGDALVMMWRGAVHEVTRFWCEDVTIFDPARAFQVSGNGSGRYVNRVNHHALTGADGVIALVPDGVASVGTPMEIQKAKGQIGIPVAVLGGGASLALQEGPLLRRWEEWGYAEVQEAVEWIRAIAEDRGQDRRPILQWSGPEKAIQEPAYEGDAGFDLRCSSGIWIRPGEFADIPTGVRVEMPHGMWGWIVARSSTLRDRGLLVNPGIIDQGYRGLLYVGVFNAGNAAVTVSAGDRLAQMIPMTLVSDHVRMARVEPEVLQDSERGSNGFGSTGR